MAALLSALKSPVAAFRVERLFHRKTGGPKIRGRVKEGQKFAALPKIDRGPEQGKWSKQPFTDLRTLLPLSSTFHTRPRTQERESQRKNNSVPKNCFRKSNPTFPREAETIYDMTVVDLRPVSCETLTASRISVRCKSWFTLLRVFQQEYCSADWPGTT